MKSIEAEVRPAVDIDRLLDEARAAVKAVKEADAKAERTEQMAAHSREEAAKRRLELGRVLIQARKQWPARGPKAKGWGEFLEKSGIEERTAERYMHLAGYVEKKVSDTGQEVSEIPTYAEAGVKKPEPKPEVIPIKREERPSSWMTELEQLAESFERNVKAAFSAAQRIDALCAEHGASMGSPSLLTARSMLAGAKATAANALQLMGGK